MNTEERQDRQTTGSRGGEGGRGSPSKKLKREENTRVKAETRRPASISGWESAKLVKESQP